MYRLLGRSCEHPTEVCLKFDELADFVIERGLAREPTREEALEVIRKSEEAGLVHFRETESGECSGCGECAAICPVEAVRMEDGVPVIDPNWCIGCGVCATVCPTEAVVLKGREDRIGGKPAATFRELHQRILEEKREKT